MNAKKIRTRTKEIKKRFVIAAEGSVTEKDYFYIIRRLCNNAFIVDIVEGSLQSSPSNRLKQLKRKLENLKINKKDEAWLVTDKDQWEEKDFSEVKQWALSDDRYNFAISIPQFELWLGLHFENCWPSSPRKCIENVKKHLPNYSKDISFTDLDLDKVKTAIKNAKEHYCQFGDDWSNISSWTNVHLLVSSMLKAANMYD